VIDKESLQEAIRECLSEQNPNARTCIKLAAYYIILDHMEKDPPNDNSFSSGKQADSEFAQMISERSVSDIIPVIADMMDDLQIVNPRMYENIIRRLKD